MLARIWEMITSQIYILIWCGADASVLCMSMFIEFLDMFRVWFTVKVLRDCSTITIHFE